MNREIFPAPTGPTLLEAFINAIKENREPECSAADNLKSLSMVFAAIQSTKEKRRVELSEIG